MKSVGPGSSSFSAIVSLLTVSDPEAPDTVTVSSSSSCWLPGTRSTNVPCAFTVAAGIVMSNVDASLPATRDVNCTALSVSVPATLTDTVWAVPNVVEPSTVAVTVTVVSWLPVVPLSVTVVGDAVKVMLVGVASSSVSEIVADDTATLEGDAVPDTVTVSLLSSTLSSMAVSVKLFVAEVAPIGSVITKLATGLKSTAAVLPEPSTVTVTV